MTFLKDMLTALMVGLLVVGANPSTVGAYTDRTATEMPGDLEVDDLKLDGADVVDTNATTRLTIGATNTFVGNFTTSGGGVVILTSTAPRTATDTAALTIVAGMLIYNSTANTLCFSTGTAQSTFVVTSTGPITACPH